MQRELLGEKFCFLVSGKILQVQFSVQFYINFSRAALGKHWPFVLRQRCKSTPTSRGKVYQFAG